MKAGMEFTLTAYLHPDWPHFQVLSRHMWLVATVPDRAAEDNEKILKVVKERGTTSP